MMGTVKPQKFGSAASRATDGLKPCLKILRDMIGMPSVSPVQGDLSKVRGLFWNHGSLALTTIYFPLIHTRLSAPGSRDSGVIILRAMSGPVQVEQGQIRLDLAKGDAIFMPSDVPLSLSLPEGGRLDCAYLPSAAITQIKAEVSCLFWQPLPITYLPFQLLVTYAGYLLQQEYQTESDAEIMVNHFYELLPILAANLKGGSKQRVLTGRMGAIKARIDARIMDAGFSIMELAQSEGITARAIQKLFKRENTTFSRYLLERRLDTAKSAILHNDTSAIAKIAYGVGFDDPAYFSRAFRNYYGVSPSDLRRQIARSVSG
ncbi:helix-turn-helix transcriptional regulator [Brucella pituitosa]|uniref:helix-turn-helix transcriptional regulator n=1 Tax=Brucella pituitosa TaxID=571256 RepID=UPI0009A1607C|nr:AraC family transcriptional regulator [Brucella pituitosa]